MPTQLSPATRLRRLPGEALSLPDGRWLVRHAGGVSLFGGPAAALIPRVLELAEAGRTVGEIGVALAAEIPEPALQRLLGSLLGDLLEVAGEAAETLPDTGLGAQAPVLIVGSGGAATALASRLEQDGHLVRLIPEVSGIDPGRLAGSALVIVAAEGIQYSELLDLQRPCLAAGVPSLFLTADPDGLRVGPANVPGVSPCLGCAQLAALAFLGGEAAGVLATAGGQRAGVAAPDVLAAAAEAVAAEVREILDPDGSPALLASLLLLAPQGRGARRLPVSRSLACPLCSHLDPADGDLARRAARRLLEAAERRPSRSLYPEAASPGAGMVRTVGILGGGTAGYLTALALRRKHPGLAVTLLESPDLPIIGVGEATTPLLPQFLHIDLGLDPVTLFREVGPTLKLGIRFLWGEPDTGDFPYPFGPVLPLEALAYDGSLTACSLQARLMAAGAVPLYPAGREGDWRPAFGTAVAYHLDNQRFVAYLQRQAAAAGVERIEATITAAERSGDGEEVAALIDRDGRRFAFDLYVDASGFRSFLLEGTLGSAWTDFRSSLWTDRAMVAPVPLAGPVRPYTTAETLSCGWCWGTPQLDADHRGYVFASAFQSPEAAEAEMRAACPGMGEARLVRFRAGRHEHFWKGNVVALGNSYAFVEPLESTALHMLIRQIGLLVQAFPLRRGERGLPTRLNRRVAAWWDYLRWFLALHYRFNRRVESPFWRACREDVDISAHGELLEAFHERGPLAADPALAGAVDFPDPLWGPEGIDLLLLGQGVRPNRPVRPALHPAAWAERQRLARAVAASAASHEQALVLLAERPDLLARFIRPFQAAGPAFPVERRVERTG